MTPFADRRSAGLELVAQLPQWRGTDAVVLGIPRGGIVVAAAVAEGLGLRMDVVVVRKLGASGHEEYAVGAIAEGVRVVTPAAMRWAGMSSRDLERVEAAERDELAPLYLRLLRGVDALYDTPTPYIAAWHQAPVRVGRDTVRLHLQLTSPRRAADKLKFLAGSEAAMGAWIGDVPPETAADRLRAAIEGITL